MQIPLSPADYLANSQDSVYSKEDGASPVSWPAIFAGTFAVLALSFILMGFGAGVGFAVVSPWQHEGISPLHFTYVAAVWLIVVQWISSGLGGYLTGRLRTQWKGVHTHEVFFRDTAHGFLTWAVATVLSGFIVALAASSALNGHAHFIPASNIMHTKDQISIPTKEHPADTSSYEVDRLFRGDHPGAADDQGSKSEAGPILTKGLKDGFLSVADNTYLTELISVHTGLKLAEADKRVDDLMTQVRQSAKDVRKTAASVSIYTFLSMLIGSFIACASAALGGQQRDKAYPPSSLTSPEV